METFNSVLVTLLLFPLGRGATTGEVTQVTMPKRPCPLPDDILPCVCVFEQASYQLDLDCSAVVEPDELSNVFKATFPFKYFRKFTIYKNNHLKVLQTGVFGEVQFEEISITWGALQIVEDGAFASSYSTALTLDLSSNQIEFFPFHNVENFTLLETLMVNNNNLTSISPIRCQTLRVLSLSHNTIPAIAADAFVGLRSLVEVHLAGLGLLQIYPGTFSELKMLTLVSMLSNRLRNLPAGAFHVASESPVSLDLADNFIRSVDVGTFLGVPGGSTITLFLNEVALLEEEVWRPTLEDNVTVVLAGNPLECGCDLEWVVLNPSAWLPHLVGATCYDGVIVADLDPSFYINYC